MLIRAGLMLVAVCSSSWLLAEDFTQFRGASGRGMTAADVPLEWSGDDSKNIAWSVEVPGAGWSQPLVLGNRLVLTSAVSQKDLRPKNFADGVKTPQSMGMGFMTRAPKIDIQWKVICLDKRDGSLLWDKIIDEGQPKFAIHPSNTYATETPVANESGIYAYFGATGKVAGLSLDGELKWEADVGVFKTSNNFGTGSSLAIHEGRVFVQNLSQGSSTITSFDCQTGEQIWQRDREKKETSWSSPIIWNNEMRSELIVSGGQTVDSFDPETGETLWTVSKVKAATACSVCADEKQIYFGGSDPFSSGPLFAIAAGAKGDISPEKMNDEFSSCAWMVKRAAPGMASPVSSGSLVYVAEKNILRCYDAVSGERIYQKRVPSIEMVNASPIIAGQFLLLLDENGRSAMVRLGREFEVAGGGKIDDTFWATPALDENSIYLRGVKKLYCVRSSK